MRISQKNKLTTTAVLTSLTGLLALGSVLVSLLHPSQLRIVAAEEHLSILAGISLIYLALLLRRGKRNAWLISMAVFAFLSARGLRDFTYDTGFTRHYVWLAATNLLLPLLALASLLTWRRLFMVRSSLAGFGAAAKRAAAVLAVALLYGSVGFQLFDHRDFHQEIPPVTAIHYTVDQLGLTTNDRPVTYSRRAVIFVDSLALISIASLGYVAVSFFAPIRFRLSKNRQDLADALQIVNQHNVTSEDFFKLWPLDKDYFFNRARSAVIAYRVTKGVALAVGDPVGPSNELGPLVKSFDELCYLNGWSPAFIHTDGHLLSIYKRADFEVQKIGEEAVVDCRNFVSKVSTNKYFRQINNRFSKLGFSAGFIEPPYSQAVLDRLEEISLDWLSRPGRAERGFMLGYFTREYMQQCRIFTVNDDQGKIMAFLNLVPSPKTDEANYDFLRHASNSPGNINDFLMMSLIARLAEDGVATLNMGLSPLAGLHLKGPDSGLIDSLLNLVYTKASRFYSFEGLTRFKKKYEPNWQNRYIVYRGGVGGFGRIMNALLRAMSR